MNPYVLPTHEEIRTAYEDGEAAVLVVFDVPTQII
jgi:hypothetical protein